MAQVASQFVRKVYSMNKQKEKMGCRMNAEKIYHDIFTKSEKGIFEKVKWEKMKPLSDERVF